MQKESLSAVAFVRGRTHCWSLPYYWGVAAPWGLAQGLWDCGARQEVHAARNISPSCTLPISHKCRASTARGQDAAFLPHGCTHHCQVLLACEEGWLGCVVGRMGDEEGNRVSCGQHPLVLPSQSHHWPWAAAQTGIEPDRARKEPTLLLWIPCHRNARCEPIKHPPKICLALIMLCTLHKYRCPWWF